MGAYNQGGGGGRAIDVTENDQFAFDQPFEIGSKFTPETANQINDMFRILFKSLKRAENKTDDLETSLLSISDGVVTTVVRNFTEAEIESLGTTPIEIIPAQGGSIVAIPIMWAIDLNIAAAYGDSPALRLRYDGDNTDLCTAIATGLGSATGRHTHADAPNTVNISGASGSPRNTLVEVSLASDPVDPGTGSATMRVQVWYLLADWS